MRPRQKIALLFSSVIIIAMAAVFASLAFRNKWIESSVKYKTVLRRGEGLRVGTEVTIAGIRAGSVASIRIDEENRVEVGLNVKKSFSGKITAGSVATPVRALMISDKKIDITPGTPGAAPLPPGSRIPGRDTLEFSDLLPQMNEDLKALRMLYVYNDAIARLLGSLDQISHDFKEVTPRWTEVTDEFVATTRELRLTCKAMQRNWMLRKHTLAVQREEAEERDADAPGRAPVRGE